MLDCIDDWLFNYVHIQFYIYVFKFVSTFLRKQNQEFMGIIAGGVGRSLI